MANSIIDSMYTDIADLVQRLEGQKEVSLQSFADGTLRKVLVLSAASWFEARICEAVRQFAVIQSNGHPGIEGIIKRKAIDRQYFTYFNWTKNNSGPFFALFGEECGDYLRKGVKNDSAISAAMSAFLELGNLRNELVHENFACFPFEKTAQEVYDLYKKAEVFVVFVEDQLNNPQLGRNSSPERSADGR